jgi:hypothetical protein
MKSNFNAQDKAILLGFSYIIISLCSLFLLYQVVLGIEYRNCKARIAKELNISSTDGTYNVLHARIETVVNSSMNSTDVENALETLYPVTKVDEWSTSDEKKAEFIALNTCTFSRNNYTFLFIYSKDGKLESFRNYIVD